MQFSFADWLKSIEDMPLLDMIMESDKRCGELERISFDIKGCVKNRERGSMELARQIKELLFFLRSLQHPSTVNGSDFSSYKPLVLKLIEKGQVDKTVLELFQ